MTSFVLVTAFVSFTLTGLMRAYALRSGMLDVPNARSSHSAPTPRGGGLAIVLTMLLVTVWIGSESGFSRIIITLCVAGLLTAITGFIDDRDHINARWRLLIHFTCAGLIVWGGGGLPPLLVLKLNLDLGIVGHILAVVGLVWILNLYNFMDGIDGIAATETVTTASAAAYLLSLLSAPQWLTSLHWGLSAAALGFLVWNFPPAKIFMGDAGSGFLGLMAGALGLAAAQFSPAFLWVWLILLGVFIVDATVTLVRRLLQRERVYEAHRSHAYQHAARRYNGHLPVTLAVGMINLFWLTPLAYAVTIGWLQGLSGLIIAYAPLLMLAFAFSAGKPEEAQEPAG